MQEFDTDTTTPKHFYLWISHGLNVSPNYQLFPIETKLKEIIFYSKPFENITDNDLIPLIQFPCTLFTKGQKFISSIDEITNKNTVYLSTIKFAVYKSDPEVINQYFGLYYANLDCTSSNIVNTTSTKLYDYNFILRTYPNGLTYSDIFKLVNDNAKTRSIDQSTVSLGIFSCQSVDETYKSQYPSVPPKKKEEPTELSTIFKDVAPRLLRIEQSKIYGRQDFSLENNSLIISPTIMPTEVSPDNALFWTALANLKRQGCGLNVLSFYNIMPQTSAREQSVCLGHEGTSIFKIVDYINNYLKLHATTNNLGHLIIRYPILDGIITLLKFMSEYSPTLGYAVIFKIYTETMYNGKINHRGHTVSFLKTYPSRAVYFIDPQISFALPLPPNLTSETVSDFFSANTSVNFRTYKFIDVIYTVREPGNFIGRPQLTFKDVQENKTLQNQVLEKGTYTYYGGKIKKTRHRHRKSKTKSRTNKRKSKNKRTFI